MKNPALGQYYGIIATSHDVGTGNYHGMYVQLQKRLSRVTTANLGTYNLLNGEGGGNQRPNQVPGISP